VPPLTERNQDDNNRMLYVTFRPIGANCVTVGFQLFAISGEFRSGLPVSTGTALPD